MGAVGAKRGIAARVAAKAPTASAAGPAMEWIHLMGFPVSKVTETEALDRLQEFIRSREPHLVVTADSFAVVTACEDEEFRRIDRVIRASTLEKFGPVRTVRPSLVFELGFEGIQRSTRHKSGFAVRFPRMLRIRDDKPLDEADTLDALRALIGIAPAAD